MGETPPQGPPPLDDEPTGRDEAPEVGASSAIEEYQSAEGGGRSALLEERGDAIDERSRAGAWLMTVGFGPAAIVAVLLALLVEGSRELALAFMGLGAAMLALKAYRADRRIKEIDRELDDPMGADTESL